MKSKLLFLVSMFCLPMVFYGQVSGYSYSGSSGSYVPIVGGLVLGDASTDDQRFVDSTALGGGTTTTGPGFGIGFSFVYSGVAFDRVGVNANGWITLGNGTVDVIGTSVGISSSTTAYVIAPFMRDLQSQTGGEVRIESMGTAPNRKLVVQWTDYKRYGTTYSGDLLNFQVVLNETSNTIDFIYGSCTTTATGTSGDPVVGLKGSSTADYKTFDGTFGALTAGTSTTSNVDFDNTTGPSLGQTMTFTPPSCFAPSALGATNVTQTTADLYWTTGGAANWNVEYGVTGFTLGTGTPLIATNDTMSIGSLMANTTYQFYVQDSCGVGDVSAFTGPFSFTTLCNAITSFPATEDFEGATTGSPGTFPGCWSTVNTSTYRWQVDNSTTTSSNTGPTVDNTLGTSVGKFVYVEASNGSGGDIAYLNTPAYDVTTLTVPQLVFYYHMYGAFITRLQVEVWNNSTMAWDSVYAITGQQQTASADPWLRATVDLSSYNSNNLLVRFWSMKSSASGNTYEGDVALDDITIRETPNCIAPSMLGSTNISSTSADVYWVSGGAANWNIEYGPIGFTPGTGTVVNAVNDTTTLGSLSQLTTYEFYVRDSCGVGDVSTWSGPSSFMTPCAAALSGTYTIDNTVATGGTNYHTLGEAALALANCGITSAVIFNMKEGTYVGRVVFDTIMGVSSTNTVTIQADPSNTNPVIVTDSATTSTDNYVIQFNETSRIILDGITVTGNGASYSTAIEFNGMNNYITIQNCQLNSLEAGSTSTNHAVIYDNTGSSHKSNYITITANEINNGSYGVYLYGVSTTDFENGHVVSDNTIQGFYNYGIRTYYQDGAMISGNTITSNVNSSSTVYGIYNGYSDNSTVAANMIAVEGSSTLYGIYNYYNDATALAPNIIANNMVSCVGNTGSTYGIYPYNNYYTDIVYNTVNVTGGSTTAGRAFYINSSSSGTYGFVNILNNNGVNTGGGYVAEITSAAVTLGYVTSSDYNNMYGTGSTLARVGTNNYVDLAAYQAGALVDANSVSVDPLFVSPQDLHVSAPGINGVATAYAGITTDIDGDLRAVTPDIGADEFTPPSCLPVSNLTIVMVYADSAIVSWTANGGSSYNLEFDTTGFAQGSGTSITGILDTFYTITGLMPSTGYDFYVQNDCGGSGTSPWAGAASFTTACASVATFPWVEDFETSQNAIPGCWENEMNDDADWIFRNGSIGHGATTDNTLGTSLGYYAGVDDSQSSANDTVNNLLTPSFDLTALTAPRLNFYYFIGNDNVLTSTLYIDVFDGTTWHAGVDTIEYSQAAWLQRLVDLTPYKSAVTRIRFRAHETTDFNSDISIDDVTVEEGPTCLAPSNLGSFNITANTAEIYWTSNGPAVGSWVEYGIAGFTPGTGTMLTVTNDTVQLMGLTALTNYTFCVIDSCGLGDISTTVCANFTTGLPATSCSPFTSNVPSDTICAPGLTGFTSNMGSSVVYLDTVSGLITNAGDTLRISTGADTTLSLIEATPTSIKGNVGPLTSIATSGFGNFSNGQWFSVLDTIRIDSMTVQANGVVEANLRIWTDDPGNGGTLVQRGKTFTTGSATADYQVPVGAVLTPGNYFMNVEFTGGAGQLFRATGGASYPYLLSGLMSIDSTNFSSQARIYYTFDMVVTKVCLGSPVSATSYIRGLSAGSDQSLILCDNGAAEDLTTYLSSDADQGGTFVSSNAASAISGNMFNPSVLSAGTYQVYYTTVATATCPSDSALFDIEIQVCQSCAGLTTPTLTSDTICGSGVVNLTASQSGTDIVWFDPQNRVAGYGTTLSTSISTTTQFVAQAILSSGPSIIAGPPQSLNVNAYPTANFTNGQYISVAQDVRIDSAIFAVNGPLDFVVAIQDAQRTDTLQVSKLISFASGDTAAKEIGIYLSPGVYFINTIAINGTGILWRPTAGANFPYGAPNILSVDSSDFGPTRLYYLYEMKVSAACLSTPDSTYGVIVSGTNAGTSDSVSVCGSNTMVDLSTYLGSFDTGGTWYDDDATGAMSTAGIFDASMVNSGVYQFTYALAAASGCPGDSATITVTVASPNTAGMDTTTSACTTQTSIALRPLLPGSINGGSWIDVDNSGALVGNSFFVSGVSVGTYRFTYYTPAGICPGDSATVTVVVSSSVDAGTFNNDTICDSAATLDLNTLLDATATTGGSWKDLSSSGGLSGSMFNPSAVVPGQSYTFRYVVTNACGADSAEVSLYVKDCTIGLKDYLASNLVLYPNPTYGNLTIEMTGDDMKDMNVEVYGLSGKLLIRAQFEDTKKTTIDLTSMPKGVYTVKVFTNRGVVIRQITKM